VLAGKKNLPAENISELMSLLRANPGKYSYASSGVGTSLQVLGEMINVEGKVHMVHVPYRSAPQIVADLVSTSAQLDYLCNYNSFTGYLADRRYRLGTSPHRKSNLQPSAVNVGHRTDNRPPRRL